MKYSKEDVKQQRERLLDLLKPGDTVYTILRHVSRSGMMRHVSLYTIKDAGPVYLDYSVACVLGNSLADRGVKVGGCGMDVGFHLVYNLSAKLFPEGFGMKCEEPGCTFRPKTKEEADEANALAGHGITPHVFYGRNGDKSGWDEDGGYALLQRWM
jgi:hypothetical protein